MTTQSEIERNSLIKPERLDTRAPLHELLSQRRSPRAFSERAIEPTKIASLFEAARWSPSSANDQPWNFIAATNGDARVYHEIADALMEGNRRWALRAPLLVVGAARSTYSKTNRPYRHAWYDLGQSIAHLTVQASALGLSVHQMGGFDAEKLRDGLFIPDGYEAVIVLAIGYADRPETLPEDLRLREEAPRMRKPLEEIVFTDAWGEPSHHVASRNYALNTKPSSN